MIRSYDPEKDQKAVYRIWREVGWIDNAKQEKFLDKIVKAGRSLVAEINDEAECFVLSAPAIFRYLNEDLAMSAVTAVTTSRIARKQGLAKKLTAHLIAADAAEGALVSALGIFEQGFYNLLGYGSGPYEHWISFDPAQLNVKKRARVPRRLTHDDSAQMHHAMLNRRRRHGAISLLPSETVEAELGWAENGFGLGYFDGPNAELTHFFWASTKGEHGPFTIDMLAFQNGEQFLELLALLKNLGDQVRLVKMHEPSGIQMQDFLIQPFRFRQLTEKSKYVNVNKATSYWQLRICDLAGCLEQTHLAGKPVRFNLNLRDPITDFLDDDAPWCGIGAGYIVTLGAECDVKVGQDSSLPMLTASVGAFSRLWMGTLPATGLAISGGLDGPTELLADLERILRIPEPKSDWDF